MEKQPSIRLGPLEKSCSFKMEKQKSFQLAGSTSFKEKKYKESPGKRGDTVLHLAARAGNLLHVQKILAEAGEEGVNDLVSKQNLHGETALYMAAEEGHVEVVREILAVSDQQSAGIKANSTFDAFHIAAKQGYLDVLKELLGSFPALAITTNSVNATALDTAATQGHVDIVNLLLETDASLARIARNNGKTALHSAARMGHVEVVKALLNQDPSIGLRTDKKGQAALHMAVKGQNQEIVLELLRHNVSVINTGDNKMNRPLHVATRKGNINMIKTLLTVEGIEVNAVNKAGETALAISEKSGTEDISAILRVAGAVTAKEQPPSPHPPNSAKHLKQTVSDIKHDVQSQLKQTHQTVVRVQKIKKRLQKLHIGGLNNAINSNTVVAVLIATVAFAAIFTVPGQFVEAPQEGYTLGQAYVAQNAAFIVFLVFDSLALFISLAVVVVQTSLIVVEQKAKKHMVFVMNKLMWLACLFISVSFISLTYVVVGRDDWWLAWSTMAIGAVTMLTTLGSMVYCIVMHRMEENSMRNLRRTSTSQSRSMSMSMPSDSELLNSEYKKIYAL